MQRGSTGRKRNKNENKSSVRELIWIVKMHARVITKQQHGLSICARKQATLAAIIDVNLQSTCNICIFHFEYICEQVLQRRY